MKKKLVALMILVGAFAGCTPEVQEITDGVKNAPSDFWMSFRMVLTTIFDLVTGVALGWLRGVLGI